MGVKMGVKMGVMRFAQGVIGLRPRASVSPFAVPIVLCEAHNFHERSEFFRYSLKALLPI